MNGFLSLMNVFRKNISLDKSFPRPSLVTAAMSVTLYLKFIVKHWRFGDKLTRILISSALGHVSPESIGTIKFNIVRQPGGERGNIIFHIVTSKHWAVLYRKNDIKPWIGLTSYILRGSSMPGTRDRPPLLLSGSAGQVWNTTPDRTDRLMLSRLSAALTLPLFIGVVHVAR